MCNISSRILLGSTISCKEAKMWLDNLLVLAHKQGKVDDSEGVRAAHVLEKEIAQTPTAIQLIDAGEREGIDKNVIVMELLYITL